jgi:hypothetical protein
MEVPGASLAEIYQQLSGWRESGGLQICLSSLQYDAIRN